MYILRKMVGDEIKKSVLDVLIFGVDCVYLNLQKNNMSLIIKL
jgi:hypothetical protein